MNQHRTAMTFSHVGVCTADIEASLRFYIEALGFEPWAKFNAGKEFLPQHGGEGELAINAHFLRRDGMQLELLEFVQPGYQGDARPRPMNQLGITHFGMLVEDIEAAMDAVRAFGGTVLKETRVRNRTVEGLLQDSIFCTDPNGVRIELMYLPESGWKEAISVGRAG
jgi:catechol 2,3-dioxygenase-like lactoylglutathione lyase family enzyme